MSLMSIEQWRSYKRYRSDFSIKSLDLFLGLIEDWHFLSFEAWTCASTRRIFHHDPGSIFIHGPPLEF